MVGNKGVIGATMATLAEFPDRRLLGEDVIWSELRTRYAEFSPNSYLLLHILGMAFMERRLGKKSFIGLLLIVTQLRIKLMMNGWFEIKVRS